MGCTASRSANFVSHHQNPTPNSSSSFSNSQLQSPYNSFSDPSSTPVSRTLSLPTPLVHHPPLRKGDSNHFVALTSTTYGSLVIVDSPNPDFNGLDLASSPSAAMRKAQDFGNSEDPLSPDSVINTWELMEGLDDDEEEFNYHMVDSNKGEIKTMDATAEIEIVETVESYEIVEHPLSKPLWQHLSEESMLAKIDSIRFSGKQPELAYEKPQEKSRPQEIEPDSRDLFSAADRIVLYYTSLRGIRKTYEDCCTVRVIFRGFRVPVDERDISMDRSYRTELQEALKGKPMSLPQVFINGKHIGGADEIKQMNESGELSNLLKAFPIVNLGCACDSCGDARFVPCPNCNGSRKVYEEEEGVLRKCPNCNENGLVRCPGCCP